MAALAWPNICWMTFTSAPDAMASVRGHETCPVSLGGPESPETLRLCHLDVQDSAAIRRSVVGWRVSSRGQSRPRDVTAPEDLQGCRQLGADTCVVRIAIGRELASAAQGRVATGQGTAATVTPVRTSATCHCFACTAWAIETATPVTITAASPRGGWVGRTASRCRQPCASPAATAPPARPRRARTGLPGWRDDPALICTSDRIGRPVPSNGTQRKSSPGGSNGTTPHPLCVGPRPNANSSRSSVRLRARLAG
jgi:hypothetical protein